MELCEVHCTFHTSWRKEINWGKTAGKPNQSAPTGFPKTGNGELQPPALSLLCTFVVWGAGGTPENREFHIFTRSWQRKKRKE